MDNSIYIIKNLDEAKLVSNLKIKEPTKVLSLSPAMEKILRRNSNFEIITTDQIYSDISHIKTVIYIRDCIAQFKTDAQTIGTISELQIEAVLYNIFYIYSAGAFFFQVMKKHEKFYFFQNRKLNSTNDFAAAYKNIMEDFFAKQYGKKNHSFSVSHRWLMASYNSYITSKFRRQKKLLILDGLRPSSKSFAKELAQYDESFKILKAQNPTKSIFTVLRHILKSRGVISPYFLYPAKTKSFKAEMDKIIQQTTNQFHKLTLQAVSFYIEEILSGTAGFEANHQVKKLAPQLVISDMFYKPSILAAAKSASENGIKMLMFNHASHTPQIKRVSKTIGNLWAKLGRIHTPYATQIAAKSPATAQLVSELNDDVKLINLKTVEKLKTFVHGDKFNFLFAGNYLPIDKHVPWITEDPYEFSKGLYELTEAIAKLPDAKLTIRIKTGKSEFDMDKLREFIAPYPNIEINNNGSFKDALSQADMIVANISTTIDEALQSGVPVLLHSWRKNYQHLPAMITPPDIENRSAVYATSRDGPLVLLLENIIKQHKNKPLTAAELMLVTWPENTLDMAGLVKQILETSV